MQLPLNKCLKNIKKELQIISLSEVPPCIRQILLAQSLELSQGLRTRAEPAGTEWLVPAMVRRGPKVLGQSGPSIQYEGTFCK